MKQVRRARGCRITQVLCEVLSEDSVIWVSASRRKEREGSSVHRVNHPAVQSGAHFVT